MRGKLPGLLVFLAVSSTALSQDIVWLKDIFAAPAATRQPDRFTEAGLESFLYDGLSKDGRPTDVFAYLGLPNGTSPTGGWPAVVLVHGGGGTAFPQAVKYWNQKGFAAIAMDLEGHLPDMSVAHDQRPSTPHPGPARFVGPAFGDLCDPIENQWPYHAVGQIIRARRILASRPEVNPRKIGILGWSWGGILACIAMGADPGYAFGIIIYGAGFLPESEGALSTKGQPKDFQSKLLKTWDPSTWLPKVVAPTFWVNGTNDRFFPLNTWQRSVDASGGSTRQLIIPDMAHGHNAAWELAELDAFAKDVVNDKPFPSLSQPSREGDMASSSVSGGVRPVASTLAFTRDSGPPVSRKWESAPATVQGNILTAAVPDGARQIFFSLTAEDGVRCSSPLLILP